MRKRLPRLICGLALAFATQPAVAQHDAQFRVKDMTRGQVAYARSARPFADCLVRLKAKEIPKFLADPDQSRAIGLQFPKAYPDCPRPSSSGSDTTFLLQTAVLEALIRRDFAGVTPPANFDRVPELVYVRNTDNRYLRQDSAILMQPYDCTTRRAPPKVQAFLSTAPASEQETAAFAGLKDDLVACHPKSERWALQAHFARRFLAEAYYTLMKVDQRSRASAQ